MLAAWKPEGQPRRLRRALTATERAQLNRRLFALECALMAFQPIDADVVAGAISVFLRGWPNQRRQSEDGEIATLEGLRYRLRSFPKWAIERGLDDIVQSSKEDHIPPDNKIVDAVRAAVIEYQKRCDAIKELLAAPVEEPAPLPWSGPSPIEMEAHRREVERQLREREQAEQGESWGVDLKSSTDACGSQSKDWLKRNNGETESNGRESSTDTTRANPYHSG